MIDNLRWLVGLPPTWAKALRRNDVIQLGQGIVLENTLKRQWQMPDSTQVRFTGWDPWGYMEVSLLATGDRGFLYLREAFTPGATFFHGGLAWVSPRQLHRCKPIKEVQP